MPCLSHCCVLGGEGGGLSITERYAVNQLIKAMGENRGLVWSRFQHQTVVREEDRIAGAQVGDLNIA